MSILDKDLVEFLIEREIDKIVWDELDLEEEITNLGFLVAEHNRMIRAKFSQLDPKWKLIQDLEEKQQIIVEEAISHKTQKELKQITKGIAHRTVQSRKSVADNENNDLFNFGRNSNDGNINVRNIKWSNNSKPTKRTKRRIRNVTRHLRRKPKHPVHK